MHDRVYVLEYIVIAYVVMVMLYLVIIAYWFSIIGCVMVYVIMVYISSNIPRDHGILV